MPKGAELSGFSDPVGKSSRDSQRAAAFSAAAILFSISAVILSVIALVVALAAG